MPSAVRSLADRVPSASQPVRRALTDWFAAETHPVNLAVVRITVFGILFETLSDGGFRRYARLPVDLRYPPPGWDAILRFFPLNELSVTAAQVAAAVFAFLALIGLFTRPAAALATLFGAYALVTPYLFGKVNHTLHHLIWFGALLAASPSGDALSVDAWRARRRGRPPPGPARAYALPIRLMWLLMGVAYFFAGFHKLFGEPRWILGDHLQLVLYDAWRQHHLLPLLRIDRHPLLFRALGLATIGFELSFLFLVISRRTRPLAVLGGLLFHLSTAYFMRLYFAELMLCYVVFVDWHALARRLGLATRSAPAARAEPGPAATAWVGGLLLAAGFGFGLARIDSWPFSVYPVFDRVRTQPIGVEIEAVLESAAGSRRAELPLGSRMVGSTLRLPEGEERERRLRALTQVLLDRNGPLQPGERLRIYAASYSTLPEHWSAPPLQRELLFDYHAGDDARPRAQP